MKTILCIIIFFVSQVGFAQNFVEKNLELSSKQASPAMARKEIMEKAMEQASEDLVRDIIGEAKFSRNKNSIQSKIIRNSGRFIPFSKAGDLKSGAQGFQMSVSLKINRTELEKLLLAQGLFYESDGTPVVLPAVRFVDRVNTGSFAWWAESAESSNFLSRLSRKFESELRKAFQKSGFYVILPQVGRYAEALPARYRTELLREEDAQAIAQRYSAQILVSGSLNFLKSSERSEAYVIQAHLVGLQSGNNRVITEVVRQFETDSGSYEPVTEKRFEQAAESLASDLASQVLDAWQKGAIGASVYQLTIKGRLTPLQQEAFKESLKGKLKDIKNVTERLIASNHIVYEIDSPIGPEELLKKLPQFEVQGVKILADDSDASSLTYKVSR